jgi:F-type H+-transporting ATPase subunit epsilon
VLLAGEVRAVMLPATEGDMTVMSGHEPTMVMLDPGIIAVTDTQGHGHRAFVRGGFVKIPGGSVSAPR